MPISKLKANPHLHLHLHLHLLSINKARNHHPKQAQVQVLPMVVQINSLHLPWGLPTQGGSLQEYYLKV